MDLAALRRWWPFAVVAALLGLAALAAGHSLARGRADRAAGRLGRRARAGRCSQPIEPTFSPQPEEEIAAAETTELPGWFVPLAAGLCSAVVLVIVGLVVWTLLRDVLRKRRQKVGVPRRDQAPRGRRAGRGRRARRRPGRPLRHRRRPAPGGDRLLGAAGAGRGRGGHPAADRRQPHRPGRAGCCSAHAVSADVLAALADVYREARYATHTVDDRMRGAGPVGAAAAAHRARRAEVATA